MSKVNSGWVRKQTAVLLSMTLTLAPVAAVPTFAADVEGSSDIALEQRAESDVEEDVVEETTEQDAGDKKNVEQTRSNQYSLLSDGDFVPRATSAAIVISADGSNETGYDDARSAAQALTDGETLVLNEDYTGEWGLTIKATNVTIDLNGHSVTSQKVSTVASNGYAIKVDKPSAGAASHTVTIKNSAQTQSVLSSSAYQVTARSGDSRYVVTLVFEGNIALDSTQNEAARGVDLGTGARIADGEAARDVVANGGFLVNSSDGNSYIYGSYANAAGATADGTVTMLHDYTGTAQINSGDHEAVLDLGGHTYTYTGGDAIAEVNYDGASLTIKNGVLTTTSNSADGVVMLYSNSSLVLDGVEVEVPNGSYGIVTNGMETSDSITLTNSKLTVTEGAGIYFPSTGSVTIDNSVITAKTTGVQVCAGDLTVQGDETKIAVTGQPAQKTENDGVIPDGAAISIVKRAGYQDLGVVSIKGGTFTSASDVSAIKAYEFSNDNKTEQQWDAAGEVVAVSGGFFSTEVPQALCADGLVPVKGSDDSNTVGVAQDKLVTVSDAQGNVLSAHDSLSDAIAAAGQGQTVALLGDVTGSVTIPADKSLTLDLAGNTLTNIAGQHTVTVEKDATLIVTDSSADKTGVIDNVSHARGALVNYGTVTVEGGTLTRSAEAGASASDNGGNSWYVIDNQGTMTFDGGTVTSTGKYSSLVRNLNGTLTINDGEFENGFIALKNDDGGVLEITGGTITSDEQAIQNWSKAEISGGTLNGPVIAWDYGEGGNSETTISDNAVINGGVTAVNYMNATQGPVITIAGGTITGEVSKGTHDGTSGIQAANPSSDTSQIVVSGGTFKKAPADEFIVLGSGLTKNPDGTFGIHEHVGTAVAAKEPTCTETGNEAHWVCSECGELFADEEMTQPTTLEAVTIGATGHQSVTHVAAKDATEAEAGNREYWHCADCGRYFLDEALTKETTLAAVTIPAKDQEPVETHTVTLVLGTGEPDVTIEVADGESLTTPAVPTYPGYTFLAWYTDAGLTTKYDLSLPVTGDLTLYAGWTKDDAKEPTKPEAPKDEGDEKDAGLAETGDATTVAPLVASAMAGASALAVGAVTLRRRNR